MSHGVRQIGQPLKRRAVHPLAIALRELAGRVGALSHGTGLWSDPLLKMDQTTHCAIFKLQMVEARPSIERIKIIERLPIWPFLTSFSDCSPPVSACPAQVSCHQ
jgi:hypothetical protein